MAWGAAPPGCRAAAKRGPLVSWCAAECAAIDPTTGAAVAAVDPPAAPLPRRLTVLPLIALIFYDVSGGPFGIEDSVRAGGGALLPILGFLILPVLWSLPEALVTAELASAFPTNAGYVAWVSAAFGPATAFLVGFSKWVSGTLDNALYPVLFLDYLRSGGGVALPPPVRSLAVLALTAALTYLNYRGLHIVGLSAMALTAFSLSPFLALTVLAAPKIRPFRWLAFDARADAVGGVADQEGLHGTHTHAREETGREREGGRGLLDLGT